MPNREGDLCDLGFDDRDSPDRDPAANGCGCGCGCGCDCGCGSVIERAGGAKLVEDRLNRLPDLIRSAKSPRMLAAADDDDGDLMTVGRVSVAAVTVALYGGLGRSDASVLLLLA